MPGYALIVTLKWFWIEIETKKDAFRTVSKVQDRALVKMFNMVLWIYLGVRMCFAIRICQGSKYA